MNSNNVKFVDDYQGTIISTLCLERQKGWVIEVQIQRYGEQPTPVWRDTSNLYTSKYVARAAGVAWGTALVDKKR